MRIRRKTRENYIISRQLKSRIKRYFNKERFSIDTEKIVGCSLSEYTTHLQHTAETNGYIDFDIHTYSGNEYHIDHIIPCCEFNLICEEEIKKCFHYSNTQILKATHNLKKSYKTDYILP